MENVLSRHFTYSKLLRYVLPSIAMMIAASVYGMIDGLFVSRFVGKTAFAAVSMVFPLLLVAGSLGIMFGTGGAALVGKTLGEESRGIGKDRANEYFSLTICAVFTIGAVLGIVGLFLLPDILAFLGAEEVLWESAILYGRIAFLALPFFIVEFAFQSFFITAGKPNLGFYATIFSGIANIVLDALFILGFEWGLFGAALATSISQALCAIWEFSYFMRPNSSLLQFVLRPKMNWSVLGKACLNGSSEMVENIAISVVAICYNYQLIKFFGENGVAVYGVIEYIGFLFGAVFFGYSMGIAPSISFQYGAKNYREVRNILQKSLVMMGIFGCAMALTFWGLSGGLALIFVGYDKELYRLATYAFSIYASAFLFIGFSIFTSAFFTALNNGTISAGLAFVRTFMLEIGCIMILPHILGMDGIWYSAVIAEMAGFVIAMIVLWKNGRRYHYVMPKRIIRTVQALFSSY